MSSRATPVQVGERIEFVDILRGFAIVGILVGNMASYSGMARDPQAYTEAVDRAIVLLTRFLVEAKFYSLFSFLFGWGMAVQMARAEARGVRFAPLYARRLLVLLGFGLLHAVFVWSGDILTTYALLGLILLFLRKRSGAFLLVTAGLALSFSIVVTLPGEAMGAFRAWYESMTGFLRSDTIPEALYATGSYGEITRLRIQEYLGAHSWFVYWIGNILGMFLLGLYVGKRRLLHHVDRHAVLLRVVLVVGLGIGLSLNGLYVLLVARPELVPSEYYRMVSRATRTIGAPALMLFYVAAIILLVQRATWRQRLRPLAHLGRGALSNYLLQSVVCTLLFYGYGLGLYGRIDPLLGLILTIVILLGQIRLSSWWFSAYTFGPAEWLWRRLIYRGTRLGQSSGIPHSLGRLRPSISWGRIRKKANGADFRVLLVVGLLFLLFWSAVFVVWNPGLQGAIGAIASTSPASEAARGNPKASSTAVAVEATGPEKNGDRSGQPDLTVIPTPVVQPVKYEPGTLAAAGDLLSLASEFNAEAAMAQIETLTGSPYLGRYPSSPEGREAGDYIAQEFSRHGLQPAGVDGSFFQPFPFEYVALKAEPRLVVAAPDGTVHDDYTLFEDYAALARWYSGSGDAEAQVVWGNECSRDDFAVAQAQDKVVLCHATSVMEAERAAIEHGAAGLLLLTMPAERPADFGHTYFEPWVPDPIPVLRVYPSLAQDLLRGSNVSLADLSLGLEPFPLETRMRVEVQTEGAEICPAKGCQARNVLGVLPGRDPEYADRVIILGAHYDHLGQGPEGTVWAGANDNASGVAVMLEIARTWHEQGYVPRHTVVFAAWDAEEEGLLGSRQYVRAPSYPLESTVAMFQLDMVGAGGDTLWIDGGGELAERLQAAAEALGVKAEITGFGRSDHVPFLESDVPANLLIWQFGDGEPRYHRPGDTPDTIQLDKLDAVGRIVGTALLGLTEGEPAIDDLLARRAAALESGDLEAFLATSLAGQEPADRLWFDGARGLFPSKVAMEATEVRVEGGTATATVRTTLEGTADGAGRGNGVWDSALSVRFQHNADGWQWAGPNLVWLDGGPGFSVAVPPEVAAGWDLQGAGELAARQYAESAALLGLQTKPGTSLLIFPDGESLRASTSPALPPGEEMWVGPGTVKLTYSAEITSSEKLAVALTQLLLAEAEVPETAAPWLWQGLPLALQARSEPTAWQVRTLPELQTVLAAGQVVSEGVTAWAAVDYLRDSVGWPGVGEFISRLGEACREGLCAGTGGADRVFGELLRTDAAGFEDTWQAYWGGRMARAQAGLDAVLEVRAAAVLAGDETMFLSTVDPEVPHHLAEEQHWFSGVQKAPLESYSVTGRPVALLDDDSFLADVTQGYRLDPGATSDAGTGTAPGGSQVSGRVLFTPASNGYRWAGIPLQTLRRGKAQILYPEGQEGLARDLLVEADRVSRGLADDLGLGEVAGPTIKLYDSVDAFEGSISPLSSFSPEPSPAWSQANASIKIYSPSGATLEDLRPALATQLARHLLQQMGVDAEWLLSGVSTYLSSRYDGGAGEQAAAKGLHDLLLAAGKGEVRDLREMPRPEEVSDQERGMVNAQAWDTVRYLVAGYGWEALADLLERQARGQDLDTALQATIGQPLLQFQAAWSASLSRAHARPEWIEMAWLFDPEGANAHVSYLASPELQGRLAGSPGAERAAAYIATGFEEAGLLPVGDARGTDLQAFFQTVPFTRTTLLAAPVLEVVGDAGRRMTSLAYRQDFLLPSGVSVGSGDATGDLLWFDDDDYGDIDLAGKIVLRRPARDFDVEVAQAAGHGAGGVILIGDRESSKELLAKTLLSSQPTQGYSIPVLELTPAGFDRLRPLVGPELIDKLDSSPVLPLALTVRIAIPVSEPEAKETVNVLGLLPGSDPVLSREVLILGAHYDYVGDDPDLLLCSGGGARVGGHVSDTTCIREEGRRYAGANDNASGIGVLLEIARLWHESGYTPQRSFLFAAWGAQELGQTGSQYYVENPAWPLENTVASVVLDGVGGGRGYYLEAQGAGEREELLLFSLQTAEELVDGRLALKAKAEESDQIPFRNAGVPALLLTWREASDENWSIEIADEVDPYRLGVTGRIVSLVLTSLAR